MAFIPAVIRSLDEDIQWHMEQCYLAEVLKKKEFHEQCEDITKINQRTVMTEICERISFEIPHDESMFDWSLVKQLIRGVLKIVFYNLKFSNVKVSKILKKFSHPVDLDALEHDWDFTKALEEVENIEEVIIDYEKLQHIAHSEIHQIREILPSVDSNEDHATFPALTEEEVIVVLSDDWWATLEEQMRKQAQARGPKIGGTPKRKAQSSDGGNSPPVTPSKITRRNLEQSYAEPDFALPDPRDAHESLALPLQPTILHQPEESNITNERPNITKSPPPGAPEGEQQVLPADPHESAIATLGEDGQRSEVPIPLPEGSPKADRHRPKPIMITDAIMRRRIHNIFFRTVPIEERRINPRRMNNEAAILFKQPATSWRENGSSTFNAMKTLLRKLTIHQADDHEFDESLYEIIENRRDGPGRSSPAHQQPQDQAPERQVDRSGDKTADDELRGDNHQQTGIDKSVPHGVQDQPMLVDAPLEQILDNEEPPARPPPIEISHPELSHSRSSSYSKWLPIPEASKTSLRSSERIVDTESITSDTQSGLTKEIFLALLKKEWEKVKQIEGISIVPTVPFNVAFNPEKFTEEEWFLALNYAMEFMREGVLIMKQSKPYDTVWLCSVEQTE